MPSLYCARCGFHLRFRTEMLWMENCPRCEGHSKTLTPLVFGPPVKWDSEAAVGSKPETVSSSRRPPRQDTNHLTEAGA